MDKIVWGLIAAVAVVAAVVLSEFFLRVVGERLKWPEEILVEMDKLSFREWLNAKRGRLLFLASVAYLWLGLFFLTAGGDEGAWRFALIVAGGAALAALGLVVSGRWPILPFLDAGLLTAPVGLLLAAVLLFQINFEKWPAEVRDLQTPLWLFALAVGVALLVMVGAGLRHYRQLVLKKDEKSQVR